jgi:hypothetical protein
MDGTLCIAQKFEFNKHIRSKHLAFKGDPHFVCHIKPQSESKVMFLPLFFLVLLGQACSVRPQQLQNNKNIFILAGQSNMAGRGGVANNTITGIATWDGIVPPQCSPNPSILKLSANLTWVLAHDPLHDDIDVNKTNGIGPGMAFANHVLDKDPNFGIIGLVPCAIGGTKISEWERGTFLYKQMMRRVQASLQNGGTIQALLWYQGESDTERQEDAKSYKAKLDKFFLDVRDDLQSPMLPIIQVRFHLDLVLVQFSFFANLVPNFDHIFIQLDGVPSLVLVI